jgi:L-serine kinase (ADP)
MTPAPEYELVPIERLRSHEEFDEDNVAELMEEIRRQGVFADPIWVARGSYVILNGHHRVEALRRLGASRVPAWVLDYETDLVSLEPWRPGLPITKAEVVHRGLTGDLFPPKTTRHRIRGELPPRSEPLAVLLERPKRPRTHRATRKRTGLARSDASKAS